MSRPIYITETTTIGELEAILKANDVPQIGLNITNGRWSAVVRRGSDVVSASQSSSLHDALDGAIGFDAMMARSL